MTEKIRWGILGPGSIAHSFAEGLKAVDGGRLTAVGSRSKSRAEEFAAEYGAEFAYGSYGDLAECSEVDVIYVASPHPMHCEHTVLCLEAGKHVLCEKPLAVNTSQVDTMIRAAQDNGCFLMEAMWTRFLPVMVQVREWLAEGRIGEVRMLTADFGFRSGWDPEGRLLNPELGGGALLDVGVYTVSLAYMIFGEDPSTIKSIMHCGETGVDEQTGMVFGYEEGELALLSCAVRTNTPQEARILGTEGSIHIPNFWHASTATLESGGEREEFAESMRGNGYNYEAEEVGRCLQAGKKESDIMPLAESRRIIATMDEVRSRWDLVYPFEE